MIAALLLALAFAQDKPAADDAPIRKTLESLVDAMSAGNARTFADHFDCARLALEFATAAGVKEAATDKMADAIRVALGRMAKQLKDTPMTWTRVRVLRVRIDAEKGEAEAYGLLYMGEEKNKTRFWLRKDGDAWKAYDMEFMELGMRLSLTMASVAAAGLKNPEDLADFRKAGELLIKIGMTAATGDLDEALALVQKAAALKLPTALAAQIGVFEGIVLAGLGRAEDSLKAVDGALAKHKDIPIAHAVRARALIDLKRHDEGIRAAEAFIARLGDDTDAYLMIGEANEALERTDAAIAAYRKGAAADDEDYENRHGLGRLLAKKGDREEATKTLLDAIAKAPEDEDLYGAVADELIEADAPAVLLEIARVQARRGGGDPRVLLHEGHALRRLGKAEESLKPLRDAITEEDVEDDAREELACALADLGRGDEALAEIEKLDPKELTPLGRYLRAYAHAAAKRQDDALKALQRALKDDPSLYAKVEREKAFEALRSKDAGRALLDGARKKSKYDEAALELFMDDAWAPLAELAAKYTKDAPGDPDGWYHLGTALRHLKKYEEARTALAAGVEREENDDGRARFWEETGYALAHLGRTADALELAGKLERLGDWRDDGAYLTAYAHALAGQEAESVRALERLFLASPHRHLELEEDPVFERVRASDAGRKAIARAKAKIAFDEKASELAAEREWEPLLKLSERRTAETPDDPSGWLYHGRALRRLGKHAEAEKSLRAGIEKASELADFHAELACVLAHLGRAEDALEYVKKLSHFQLHWTAACVHALVRNEKEALAALEKALDINAYLHEAIEEEAAFESLRKSPGYEKLMKKAQRRLDE